MRLQPFSLKIHTERVFKTNEDLFPQSDHINGFSSKDGTHF